MGGVFFPVSRAATGGQTWKLETNKTLQTTTCAALRARALKTILVYQLSLNDIVLKLRGFYGVKLSFLWQVGF
jgi:hypothetical protein